MPGCRGRFVERLGQDDLGIGLGAAHGFGGADALALHLVELVAAEELEEPVGEGGRGESELLGGAVDSVALELVELALEAGIAGAGEGELGETDEATLLVADEVERQEAVEELSRALLVGALLVWTTSGASVSASTASRKLAVAALTCAWWPPCSGIAGSSGCVARNSRTASVKAISSGSAPGPTR
jgi:hypothetical protein